MKRGSSYASHLKVIIRGSNKKRDIRLGVIG